MDYGNPSFRKTKGDKKAKRKFGHYKRGGKHRSDNVGLENKEKRD